MYYCDNDFIFFLRVLNTIVAFGAMVIVAWTRHGETVDPDALPEDVLIPSAPMGGYFNRQYMAEVMMYDVDPLTEDEKKTMRNVFIAGENFSFRVMAKHGMTRTTWNELRGKLVGLGLAEWRDGGAIQFNAGIYVALNISPTGADVP
jgi:hypothetical protein